MRLKSEGVSVDRPFFTQRYVQDEYAQQHPAFDGIDVNCILSWRVREDGVMVDTFGGWFSTHGAGKAGQKR